MNAYNYDIASHYDELFEPGGKVRNSAVPLIERISSLPEGELTRRQQAAEAALLHMGITFTVYGNEFGTDQIFPLDIIPRIIGPEDWDYQERGLKQRIYTLNLFLQDIYNEQRILKDRVIPAELINSAKSFLPQCMGLTPPKGFIY